MIGFINCETDSAAETEAIEQIQEETIDFSKQPSIETVTLNQLNKDSRFNEIKNNFGILQSLVYPDDETQNKVNAFIETLSIEEQNASRLRKDRRTFQFGL